MTIYFFKGLARKLEIRDTPVWVLPNIKRLGQVRDTKNVPNEFLLNVAKYHGYSFYHFKINKKRATGVSKYTPLSPQTHTTTHIMGKQPLNHYR